MVGVRSGLFLATIAVLLQVVQSDFLATAFATRTKCANVPSPFTGTTACPNGTKTEFSITSWIACPGESTGTTVVYFCVMESPDDAFGGAYTRTPSLCVIKNPFTNGCTCPPGLEPLEFGGIQAVITTGIMGLCFNPRTLRSFGGYFPDPQDAQWRETNPYNGNQNSCSAGLTPMPLPVKMWSGDATAYICSLTNDSPLSLLCPSGLENCTTRTQSATVTPSATFSGTNTVPATPTLSSSVTGTKTPSLTAPETPSATNSVPPTSSSTQSQTSSPTQSMALSASRSTSTTPPGTRSLSSTQVPSSTPSPTPAVTSTRSSTLTPTAPQTKSGSPSDTFLRGSTVTPEATRTTERSTTSSRETPSLSGSMGSTPSAAPTETSSPSEPSSQSVTSSRQHTTSLTNLPQESTQTSSGSSTVTTHDSHKSTTVTRHFQVASNTPTRPMPPTLTPTASRELSRSASLAVTAIPSPSPQPATLAPASHTCADLTTPVMAQEFAINGNDVAGRRLTFRWTATGELVNRSRIADTAALPTLRAFDIPSSEFRVTFREPEDTPSDTGFDRFVSRPGNLVPNANLSAELPNASFAELTLAFGSFPDYHIEADAEYLDVWLAPDWFADGHQVCGSPLIRVATVIVEPSTSDLLEATKIVVEAVGGTALVATVAMGGAGGTVASNDITSLAILSSIPCARPGQKEAGSNSRMISPLPLSTALEGKLLGNFLVISIALLLHGGGTAALVTKKHAWSAPLAVLSQTRFPAWTLMFLAVFYQGTAFLSLRLLIGGGSTTGGLGVFLGFLGLLYFIGMPSSAIWIGARFIDATFYTYDYSEPTIERPEGPPARWLQQLLPHGRWESLEMRRAYGGLVGPFEKTSPLWFPFTLLSPAMIAMGAAPQAGDAAGCIQQYGAIAAFQACYVVALVVLRPYRSNFENICSAASSSMVSLVALSSALAISDPTNPAPRTLLAVAMLLQSITAVFMMGFSAFKIGFETRAVAGVHMRPTLRRYPRRSLCHDGGEEVRRFAPQYAYTRSSEADKPLLLHEQDVVDDNDQFLVDSVDHEMRSICDDTTDTMPGKDSFSDVVPANAVYKGADAVHHSPAPSDDDILFGSNSPAHSALDSFDDFEEEASEEPEAHYDASAMNPVDLANLLELNAEVDVLLRKVSQPAVGLQRHISQDGTNDSDHWMNDGEPESKTSDFDNAAAASIL